MGACGRVVFGVAVILQLAAALASTSLGGLSNGEELPLQDAATDRGRGEAGTLEDGGTSCGGNTSACGPVCVDLTTDGKNCGRCGRDCLGAACTNGACGVVPLLSGLNIPQNIALDAEYVYATVYAENKVIRVKKTGGAPEVISTDTSSPWGLALGLDGQGKATHVAWGEARLSTSNFNVCAVPTCGTQVKVQNASAIRGVAVAGNFVYFAHETGVSFCPFPSCLAVTAVGGAEPEAHGLIVTSSNVLLFSRRQTMGKVRRMTTSGGGAIDLITPLDDPEGIATDGTSVFVAVNSGSQVAKCPILGCTGPSTFAFATYPHGVATDGVNVYWANGLANGGSVGWCPVGGCGGNPKTLAPNQANPYGIAVDEKAVYWATSTPGGGIFRIARP
jgi:hypothetical protein